MNKSESECYRKENYSCFCVQRTRVCYQKLKLNVDDYFGEISLCFYIN